jgi:cell division protein FtsB
MSDFNAHISDEIMIDSLTKENESLRAKVKELEAQNTLLHKGCSDMEDSVDGLQTENDQLRSKVAELEAGYKTAVDMYSVECDKNEQLRSMISEIVDAWDAEVMAVRIEKAREALK